MKGKRDSREHSLRALLDAFQGSKSKGARRTKRERTSGGCGSACVSISPLLAACWWKFERSYPVVRFTSRRLPASPLSLSRETESACPRTPSGSSVVPRWTSVGRLILKRESPSFRLQARNIIVNFRDPELGVIITELNPNVGATRLPSTYKL